jgi:hypothetical protein
MLEMKKAIALFEKRNQRSHCFGDEISDRTMLEMKKAIALFEK